jgi:hypothetical protein
MSKSIYPLCRGIFLLLLAVLLGAGCFPGVAWFPDSSGLVFTDNKGRRLVHYDVKTNRCQVLVEDTRAKTLWPAVSPDGKRIAVAAWQRQGHLPSLLQVAIYLSTGAEEWRSNAFTWNRSGDRNQTDLGNTEVFWLTKDRLLVTAGETALYERDRDRLVRLPGVEPYPAVSSPVRPDGKGFLALHRTQDGNGELAFVDWGGKVHPIAGNLPGEPFPLGFLVHWEKDTAVLAGPTMALRANTRTGKLTRSKERPAVLPAAGDLFLAYPFPRARMVLCLYQDSKPRPGETQKFCRIELHDLAARKRRVVVDRCGLVPLAFPSPDGKMVALHYLPNQETIRLLILDSAGKKVGEFDVD